MRLMHNGSPRPRRRRRPIGAPWPGRAFQRLRRSIAPAGKALVPVIQTGLHPSEGGATAAAPPVPAITSLATLLTRHVLRDGELVILILRPSLWFVFFSTLRFAAVALI